MAERGRITEDMTCTGDWTFTEPPSIPASSYGNREFDAGDPLAAAKVERRYSKHYAQESATTAADEARVLHVVVGATGTIQNFKVGCVVANIGDSKVEFDLKKNGVSILTAVAEVNVNHAAYALVSASIATAAVVAGNVLEVSINATIGTGTLGKGAFCELVIDESAA